MLFRKVLALKGSLKDIMPTRRNFVINEIMVWLKVDGVPLCTWGQIHLNELEQYVVNLCCFKDNQDVVVSCGCIM